MNKQLHWKQFIGLSLALILGLLLFSTGTEPLQAQESNWEARYWDNITLSGTPVLQRTEANIDYDWGDDAPHPLVPDDNFSAEWVKSTHLFAGNYRFTATMDDGMRVWVDNNLVIDSWTDSQVHSLTADVYLTTGTHQIRVAYYEVGGKAVAKLNWAQTTTPTQGAWLAQYFNNTTLAGEPAHVQNEPAINLDTIGAPAPQIGSDNFSVRWTQTTSLNAGRYRFTATADDGVRLWVNNQLVINEWRDQAATDFTADIDLPGGAIPIQMEYYENGGGAVAQLSWVQIAAVPLPVPLPTTGSWRAEYFNNTVLAGEPALVRNDARLNFNWGSGSPAPNIINVDGFSVRWTQTFNMAAGTYQLTGAADDGIRVWVNGQQVIDSWQMQAVAQHTAVINHLGGQLAVIVEYFENMGLAEARLDWAQVGTTPTNPTTEGATATMTGASYLNVRSGPGLEHEPFAALSRNQTVAVVGRDAYGIWLEVQLPDGNTGWVSSRYLTTTTPVVDLPITG